LKFAEHRYSVEGLTLAMLPKTFDSEIILTKAGTLDGGDVCEAGNHFFIGVSSRTNGAGAQQLAELLADTVTRAALWISDRVVWASRPCLTRRMRVPLLILW